MGRILIFVKTNIPREFSRRLKESEGHVLESAKGQGALRKNLSRGIFR